VFKFIHCADVHLDSPLQGLERYEGAPVNEIRLATRRALENLVTLAQAEKVSFVLIAGDLFDGTWKDYNTGLFFVRQMARLKDAGIRVVLVAGNHDADNKMTRTLRWPDNVKVMSSRQPESHTLSGLDVVVHGQSFATAAVAEDLTPSYPLAVPGMFNIGLLHTAVTGREGHAPYAPCTLTGLRAKNYQYWALGHVHNREVLSDDPPIVFPGNIQGRHIRETGARGCILVTVDDRRSVSMQFEPLDVFRWEKCQVDASGSATRNDLIERFAQQALAALRASETRPLAMRVEFSGTTTLDAAFKENLSQWTNEVRAAAIEFGAGQIWVEKVKFHTTSPGNAIAVDHLQGPLGELSGLIREVKDDLSALEELAGELSDLRGKLPPEVKDGGEGLHLDSPEFVASLLDDVESLLVGRLVVGGHKQ